MTLMVGTSVTFATGSTLNGRTLAQTAVTFEGRSVVELPSTSTTAAKAVKSNLRSSKTVNAAIGM
jgi:BarA-like signal transduction histidine kinase